MVSVSQTSDIEVMFSLGWYNVLMVSQFIVNAEPTYLPGNFVLPLVI